MSDAPTQPTASQSGRTSEAGGVEDVTPESTSNDTSNETTEVEFDSRQLTKLLVELGPLVVFFLVNSQAGIFYGTGAFMAATAVSLSLSRYIFGHVPVMPLVTGVFVMVFGGLTLFLQDDIFIKMKPTIVNLLFAGMLAAGLYFRQNLLRFVFADAFKLTDLGWRKLTVRWIGFFIFLSVLNEVVWRNFDTDFWVNFKVFGIMPLTMAFAIAQVGLLKEHELKDGEAIKSGAN